MLLGIAGPKNSGKDTCAYRLELNLGGAVLRPFAWPVKRVCQELFLLSYSQLHDTDAKEKVDSRWGMSPRQMFQQVGTDYVRRQLDPNHWLKHFELWYQNERLLHPKIPVIVPDVRFQNEVDLIHKLGGKVIYVYRPFVHNADAHESETSSVQLEGIDYTLDNCGTLSQFYQQIDFFMERL